MGKNSGGLFEFGSSGGLIKSGGLYASIRYFPLLLTKVKSKVIGYGNEKQITFWIKSKFGVFWDNINLD